VFLFHTITLENIARIDCGMFTCELESVYNL